MNKISVVITTVRQEEDYLPFVLASVVDFSDEIIIVDMSSSDKINNIAKKFNAKVYPHKFVPYVEPVRNYGISKAKGDWVLILDPDEEVPKSLAKKLKDIVKKPEADYFRIPRKNIIFGKWMKHSRFWPDLNIRFFRKGMVKWNEIIHTVPETYGRGFDIPALTDLAIIHHHYKSIDQFIIRLNRYTEIQSENKIKEGYKFNWLDLLTKPCNEFQSRFFSGEGYKDGLHGLTMASLQAFSELILYLKLWQKNNFIEQNINVDMISQELHRNLDNFDWWVMESKIKSSTFPKNIFFKIMRKFYKIKF